MPRYRYTDVHERVLTGLAHGVNAVSEREPSRMDGSTVVAQHGDVITTRDEYPHAHLELLDAEATPPRRPRRPRTTPATAEPQE